MMKKLFGEALSSRPLQTFMVIIGTVIGSGFLSGKEIVVFFTRFGKMSYLCIFLAFLLFFGLFYFFLTKGSKTLAHLNKSKFTNLLNCLICFILSGAMFAGIFSLLEETHILIRIIVMAICLFYSIRVVLKGATLLEKLNLILVPLMIIFLIFNLFNLFALKKGTLFVGSFFPFSIFYCFLYVILNTSNSSIVISSLSEQLSKKQKVQVSFFSSLTLSLILLFANIVLLQNSYAFSEDMPLLTLFNGWQKIVMSIIILLGCITTLFSLVYTMSNSLRGVCDNIFFVLTFSVVLPFVFSFLGFGFIVANFYPITSVLGIFLLCELFLIPFFKKAYKKIHSASKHTKQDDT